MEIYCNGCGYSLRDLLIKFDVGVKKFLAGGSDFAAIKCPKCKKYIELPRNTLKRFVDYNNNNIINSVTEIY